LRLTLVEVPVVDRLCRRTSPDHDKPEKRKAPGGFPPEADLKPVSSLWDEPDQKLR
jgi:hypothetical protein